MRSRFGQDIYLEGVSKKARQPIRPDAVLSKKGTTVREEGTSLGRRTFLG